MDRDERMKGAELMREHALRVIDAAILGNSLSGGPYANAFRIVREGIESLSASGIIAADLVHMDAARRGFFLGEKK